jgi:hypothetical protein
MELLLPTGYLSYSQYTCWKTSPGRYRREYFEGGKKLDTKYLRFGKEFAEKLERGEILNMPSYHNPEVKMIVIVAGVPTIGYIDDMDKIAPHPFNEYKTGKIPWTAKKVQKHEQLPWYSMQIKWSNEARVISPYCNLVWVETVENLEGTFWDRADKALKTTGRIEIFRRDFDEREIERLEKDVVKVALEISEAYRAFIKEI